MTRSGALIVVVVALVVAITVIPGVAAAQDVRSGDTVVVEEGESVDGFTATSGTVIVRGTVNGDLEAFTGNVIISGTVTGDVTAFTGNVRISGTVEGNVEAFGGNVFVTGDGQIGNNLDAAAGTVSIRGTINGNANVGAGTLTLGPNAQIGGDLSYDAELINQGATISGELTRTDALSIGPLPQTSGWLVTGFGFLANLLLGVVLLLALPGFTSRVATRVTETPVASVAIGLLVLIGVPIVLVLLAITVIGIPLTLVGAILYVISLWVATVLGAFALGAWGLSLMDIRNRWAGLLVGLVLVAALGFVPIVGSLFTFVLVLLGLGAMGLGFRRHRTTTSA